MTNRKTMNLPKSIIEWCEYEALSQCLVGWGDLTYKQVIESLESDGQNYPSHKEIMVWQAFEGQWAEFLVSQIKFLYESYICCAEFTLKISGEGK